MAVNHEVDENNEHFSLFGSKFYYSQSNIGRAFLYLHTTSWEGIHANVNAKIRTGQKGGDSFRSSLFDTLSKEDGNGDSFEDDDKTYTIKGLYGNDGSFIKAPKLWCAFIGGLLYRHDNALLTDINNTTVGGFKQPNGDIIKWGWTNAIGVVEYLLPWQDSLSYTPNTSQYLYEVKSRSTCGISLRFDAGDTFRNDNTTPVLASSGVEYPDVDQVILGLPTS